MWKGLLVYWLVMVGGAAVFLSRGSRWPPDVDTVIAPISVVAILAGVFIALVVWHRHRIRRRALQRTKALAALDELTVTSSTSRARFLAAVAPLMNSSSETSDELENRMSTLFHAIASFPPESMDFSRLHELHEAVRGQRDLERWSAHWLPPAWRELFPELGPPPRTVGLELGILAAGVLAVIKALEQMSGRSVWSLPWPGVFFVLPVALRILAAFVHHRIRAAFRTAAPELFSAEGRPRIPEGYDRNRN
jgi:hypothetical protein